jgi:nucleotide-binding universal stress UspA family protein
LDAIVAENQNSSFKQLNRIVTVGSIFYSIEKIAKEEGAQLIIMGVKNTSGFQKLFRSNAIKVISSTEVPFLLVQKETEFRKISKIVVPIDVTKESLQIVNNASELASIFNAVIHVVAQKQSDETHSQQIKNRILLVKKQYEERHVPSVIEFLPQSGSFQKQIINYVSGTHSDLIALAYHSESLLPQFDNFAQDLISNNQYIPCIVLNSKLASALYF